jgi:pimeloyl-ACP methyl ester carboxylesterase
VAIAHVNGVDLYYEVHGSGEPLFLTHGSWGDATAWQAVIPGLAERFEVVIWDRRGHSRSSDGDGPGSLQEDATDLAALVEHLDRRSAHVHGSSAGAIVVLNMVISRPDLIASAAIHEPPVMELLNGTSEVEIARALANQQVHLDKVKTLIEAGGGRKAAEYFFDNVAVGPGAWEHFPEGVRAALVANASTYADELSDPAAWTMDTRSLGTSEVPIMITLGTESPPLILAATRELIQQTPSAHVETLDGAGHVPYRTHPKLWLETLLGYLGA